MTLYIIGLFSSKFFLYLFIILVPSLFMESVMVTKARALEHTGLYTAH
jgi:hypothetical protein